MELNIKWIEIGEVDILKGVYYFVADIHKGGSIKDFCIAYKVMDTWRLKNKDFTTCSFKITHVCPINGITHKIIPPPHVIGDKVRILKCIREYKIGSIGEVVGKYYATKTWGIRMEDNYIIILEEKEFNHYFLGGT